MVKRQANKELQRVNDLATSFKLKYKKWPNRVSFSSDIYKYLLEKSNQIQGASLNSNGTIYGLTIFIKKGIDRIEVSRIMTLKEDSE